MATMQLADDRAVGDIERREQAGDAVPEVVMEAYSERLDSSSC
jgi:hypothetical protein